MAHGDHARQVRESLQRHGVRGAEVQTRQVAVDLDLVSPAEKKLLHRTLYDFAKRGEIQRVRQGVYIYIGKSKSKTDKRGAIWRVLRARRHTTTTVSDLQAMCGVSEGYAKEYLQMLCSNSVLRRFSGGHRADGGEVGVRYRLIKDPGPGVPADEKKAARLRKIRGARKKAALAALAEAEAAILKVRELIKNSEK